MKFPMISMKRKIVPLLFAVWVYSPVLFLGEAAETATTQDEKRVAATNLIQALATSTSSSSSSSVKRFDITAKRFL